MKNIETFKKNTITNIYSIRGGGFETGGGRKSFPNSTFNYESDYSTWSPGSTSWKVSYYGVRACDC